METAGGFGGGGEEALPPSRDARAGSTLARQGALLLLPPPLPARFTHTPPRAMVVSRHVAARPRAGLALKGAGSGTAAAAAGGEALWAGPGPAAAAASSPLRGAVRRRDGCRLPRRGAHHRREGGTPSLWCLFVSRPPLPAPGSHPAARSPAGTPVANGGSVVASRVSVFLPSQGPFENPPGPRPCRVSVSERAFPRNKRCFLARAPRSGRALSGCAR